MFQPVQEDFFQMSLSQEGASYLYRVYKITRWMFVAAVALSCLILVVAFAQHRIYSYYNTEENMFLAIEARLFPAYAVFVAVTNIVQMYFFVRFSRLCKKSLDTRQADLFNHSFKWLYRNTALVYILFLIQLLIEGFTLMADIDTLQLLEQNGQVLLFVGSI